MKLIALSAGFANVSAMPLYKAVNSQSLLSVGGLLLCVNNNTAARVRPMYIPDIDNRQHRSML